MGRIVRCLCLPSILRLHQQESNEEDDDVDDGRPLVYSVWDVEYMYLSQGKKHQINLIRAREIGKYLANFSSELSVDNMVMSRQPSDDIEHDDKEKYVACIDVKDAKDTLEHEKEGGSSSSKDDTEEACITEPSSSIESSSSSSSSSSIPSSSIREEAITYTHIRLPQPGYNKNGIRKLKKTPKSKSATESNQRMGLVLFRRSGKKDDASNKQAKKASLSDMEDDDAKVLMEDNNCLPQTNDDNRREVPIFCAICLGEYEPSDKVCWSSNTECTHVFHHDCMLQWLKSLGKRVCKQQRFSENPTVKQVLNFAMECPCCRQSFIDKSVDVGVDVDIERGDDNV
ncbi:hypothetical protein ACHAXM_004805 [Skeletonema potamos]